MESPRLVACNLIYLDDLGLTLPRMFGSSDKSAHISKLSRQAQLSTERGKVSLLTPLLSLLP